VVCVSIGRQNSRKALNMAEGRVIIERFMETPANKSSHCKRLG
jgi:hypothetical protein